MFICCQPRSQPCVRNITNKCKEGGREGREGGREKEIVTEGRGGGERERGRGEKKRRKGRRRMLRHWGEIRCKVQ